MKIFNTICLTLIISYNYGQFSYNNFYKNFKEKSFTTTYFCDTIEGVYIGDLDENKPLILFIRGSGLNPVYCSVNDSTYHPLFPHQILDSNNNYIVFSKPGIPLITKLERLDKNYNFLIKGGPPKAFFIKNTLNYNVGLYKKLIQLISDEFNYSELIVMGHSQGARIVAELSSNTTIDKLIFMSADPLGRIASIYDKKYSDFSAGNEDQLNFYDSIFIHKNKDSIYWNETYESWVSYSKPSIISLSNDKIPTLIVYGGLDKSCPNCYIYSFLPNYYNNISVLKYNKFNHNYFDLNGNNNWKGVTRDIFKWVKDN